MKIVLVDGYVDEPTCLGVPPYVSTYVRYIAGAIKLAGNHDVQYKTIEQVRESTYQISGGNYELGIIVAGNPVPGKYLGGLPIKGQEIQTIADSNPKTTFLLGGPIQYDAIDLHAKNLKLISLDIESYLFDTLSGKSPVERQRNIEELNRFAEAGAFIMEQHPRYPDIIAEVETGRGCPRKSHCSFCIEGNYKVEFREPEAVIAEIKALRSYGIKHFRLGKQADLFAYGSSLQDWKKGFSRPSPENIKALYEGIRSVAPDLEMLHLDNVNPGTLAHFPDESLAIAETIVRFNTPGDVAALGMESADPEVVRKNFLKCSASEVKTAIALINQAGGLLEDGIPKLLPGVNLIRGLLGEGRDTFQLNFNFLKNVLDDGLLLRRINIRQIKPSRGTFLENNRSVSTKEEKKLDAVFRNYREKIRQEIDVPMIRKIFPAGTIMRGIVVEAVRGDWSIARPLGTYAVAVNIPKILPLLTKLDIFVIDYRERSLVGLPYPFDIAKASLAEIKQIPGLSKKASELFSKRDFTKDSVSVSPIYKAIADCIRFPG